MTLDSITETIRSRLLDLAGLGYKVKFDLGELGAVLVDATGMQAQIVDADGEADCTIKLAPDDMRKLIDGSLNPMLAYTLGKLKIEGSKGVAMKLAAALDS